MFDAKNFAKHMGAPDRRGLPHHVPYNVINTSATETVVELSVAGFARSDLQVTVEPNRLHVEGTAPAPLDPLGCTVRQFSVRSFRNTFVLATGVEVERCTLIDGVMRLVLKSAASAPVRKVEIDACQSGTDAPTTTASATSKVPPKPEYLTERVGTRPQATWF